MKKVIFILSILLNIVFGFYYLSDAINEPTRELGRLKKDIEIGYFSGDSLLFKLPKGLTVADESQRGISAIGQFENNRFSIVITSNEDLVEYEINEDSLNVFSNFYSTNITNYKTSYYLGLVTVVECTVSADIVEFNK